LLPVLPPEELGLHGGAKRRHEIGRLHRLLEVAVHFLSGVVAARAAPRTKVKQKPDEQVAPVDGHERNHHFAHGVTRVVIGGAVVIVRVGVLADPHGREDEPHELHSGPQDVACHARVVAHLR